METLSLSCKCKKVQGTASRLKPAMGNHIVCLCDDCQAYAHFLKQKDLVLDKNGGTEIFQITPSQISIAQGADQIRCVRLQEKGLMRWYAGCCNTPIANSMASPKVPFAGLVHSFVSASAQAQEKACGPVLGGFQGRYGIGKLPPGTYQKGPLKYLFRALRIVAIAWMKGLNSPSPFFDTSGTPVSEPKVLSTQEREALRPYCGPHPTK